MKTRIIRKSDRRIDQNSWRTAWHEYYPGMTNFGQLTGFNLDVVAPGQGFGIHPHRDMEIITIPTDGAQVHKDSLGNEKTISTGEIQVMSAGSGIQHSEMNASSDKPFTSYQIWIYPNKDGLSPSYQQKLYNPSEKGMQLLVSPNGEKESLTIHQNAWLSYLYLENESNQTYQPKAKGHGIYIQMASGKAKINGELLFEEDSIEISSDRQFEISAKSNCNMILIETEL
jgi:redox-sensitive bicupin YhaK (pirin superfamily)